VRRQRVVDYPLVALALILSAFGIAMVYSAGQTDVPSALVLNLWKRQLVWLAIGIVAAYFASRASVRLLDWMATPIYVATCVVLLLLLFVGSGSGTAASTKSWLAVGGVKLGQPAELAKIAVVLMLAKVLASRRDAPKSLLDLWWPGLVVAIPWLLIMAQPDLGTALVFIGIFFAMLFWSGASWQLLVLAASPGVSLMLAFSTNVWGAWFLLFIGLVVWYKPYIAEGVFIVLMNVAMGVVAPLVWDRLSPYQRGRFVSFLDPKSDPLHSGYHVLQSQVAIGSGGWIGKGFTAGTQKRLAFLPAQQNDFIFPVVGEELGFLGVTIALTLFLLLFLRCVRVSARATDSFASLIAFGLVATWFVHLVVNVGMSLNLMPITGIPLPFFSYGGSFMLACWIAVGIEVRLSAEGRGKADMLVI
jgi:rod shape determining protein RodA